MGQQQLLLLVLGTVLVGLAVVVGIQAFQENQRKNALDQLLMDTRVTMESIRAWAEKPGALGGPETSVWVTAFTFDKVGYPEDRVYQGGPYPGTCMKLPGGGNLIAHRGYVASTEEGALSFEAIHHEYEIRYTAVIRTHPYRVVMEPTISSFSGAQHPYCVD